MKLSDKKKRQIILASVKEFRDKGFSATSMDNVAQRAEVSKRTVYNHFESKDALFFGIVDYMFGLIAETTPKPYDSNREFAEQLIDMARTKIDLLSSEEFLDLSRVAIPEAILNPQRMQQAMAQLENIESNMERWFAAAAADKKLPTTSAQEACELLTGLVKMEAFWPRLLKGKANPSENEKEEMAKKAVRMFRCYFSAQT